MEISKVLLILIVIVLKNNNNLVGIVPCRGKRRKGNKV